jgi:nucleotide-binding universal stress UspA family protein
MSAIVCAIRGGPDSQATIAQALALARQTDLPLHFLYVINVDFLSIIGHDPDPVLLERMRQMGESVLSAAQALAGAKGIVVAEGVVRYGNVEDEIAGLCREHSADYLVLGRPRVGAGEDVFTEASLRQFIERLEARAGVQVVLPDGDLKRGNGGACLEQDDGKNGHISLSQPA